MNPPLLTIITVTKDDARGLTATLASAAALHAAGVRHLVIDGSVVPVTRDQIASWVAPEVVLRARPARGVADAFNAGLAEVRTEWVWFLNGGDRVDEGLSPEFLFALLQNSRAQVIVAGVTYDDADALRTHFPISKQWPPISAWIPHPATLIRKSMFDHFGLYDSRYKIAMDYEWWLRALRDSTKVDVLAVPFSRFAGGGMSQRPESLPMILAEQRDAFRRHQRALWKTWVWRTGRLLLETTRALFERRLPK